MDVPIVIPAFNAGLTIGAVVEGARLVADIVLVVDDGSHDNTAEQALLAGARVHRLPINRGKGAALRAAMELLFNEGATSVVTMDADGQHVTSEVPRLVEVDADIVLGIRTRTFGEMSDSRRRSNIASSWAISKFAGVRLADAQTGFRKYSRRCFEQVGFRGDRFDAESSVLVRAARKGLSIVEVPVEIARADGRLTSHYRAWVDSLRIARAVVLARLMPLPRSARR